MRLRLRQYTDMKSEKKKKFKKAFFSISPCLRINDDNSL